MNFLEIQPTTVHLTGISRTAYFRIKNKNDFLAASYSIEVLNDEDSDFQIFPEKGILMGGQQQKIKIKHRNSQSTQCSLEETNSKLLLKFTYKTQYNRHYLHKNGMKGWSEIPSNNFSYQIDVISGREKEAIENYIKEEIAFTKSFGKGDLNISVIQKKDKSEIFDNSLESLQIQSKFQHTHQKQPCQKQKQSRKIFYDNSKISIDVDNIFPLQFGQSRITNNSPNIDKQVQAIPKKQYQMIESKIINQQLSKSFSISMKTAKANQFSNQLDNSTYNQANRTFDIIIIAVIAAFFVALGNNMGRLIK